jgi:MoxR-like ATPase
LNGERSRHGPVPCAWQPDSAELLQSGQPVWRDPSNRLSSDTLFSQVLLADEINRASPRTQSALLEAMAAGRVSVDGVSHPLPKPFLVIATQNGLDQVGTAPLPESQLDRFLMQLSLGYPDRRAERNLLSGQALPPASLEPLLDGAGLLELQQRAAAQHCSSALLDYVLDLAAFSRRADQAGTGLSPRACQGLVAAARAWSLLEGRDHVTPADVQAVLPAVAEHRLAGDAATLLAGVDGLR